VTAVVDSPGPAGGLLVVLSLLISACGSSVPQPDQVAELDGEAISYVAFEEFLQRNSVAGAGVLGSDILSSLLDRFLDEQLLARLAVDRLGLAEGIDASTAAQALLAADGWTIDEAAVASYYRQNLSRFDFPERVHLRQLLFADRVTAERIRELWSQGVPYRAIAEELASAPATHVGEEGEFSRQELPPAFAEILFVLADGEVSDVMPVDYGFHVFQVVRHLGPGVVPLEEVSESIAEDLVTRQREEFLVQLAAEARERYNVRVFQRNLPFNYLGRYESNNTHENS